MVEAMPRHHQEPLTLTSVVPTVATAAVAPEVAPVAVAVMVKLVVVAAVVVPEAAVVVVGGAGLCRIHRNQSGPITTERRRVILQT